MAYGRVWPADIQLEYCEFCGVRVPAAKRIQATTQEYAGRWACEKCAPLLLNPSYLDYGGPGNLAPTPGEIEPHSGVDWITEIQGGSVPVTTFYVGATTGETPADDLALSSALYSARAVPFAIPRPPSSNTVATVSVKSNGYAGSVKAAIYTLGVRKTNRPGLLVADLGSQTVAAFGTATFSPDLYLDGSSYYVVVLQGTSAGVLSAFSASQSSEIIADGISNLGAPVNWYTSAWPLTGGPIPWTQLATNFFAVTVNLDT